MILERTISYPFRIENGSLVATTDYQKIWQDRVLAAVSTAIGERPTMRADFGTTLANMLWANIDDAAEIATEQVTLAFAKHLPDLALSGVEVYETYQDDMESTYLEIEISYILPNGDEITAEALVGTLDSVGDVLVEESYENPVLRTQDYTDVEEQP